MSEARALTEVDVPIVTPLPPTLEPLTQASSGSRTRFGFVVLVALVLSCLVALVVDQEGPSHALDEGSPDAASPGAR